MLPSLFCGIWISAFFVHSCGSPLACTAAVAQHRSPPARLPLLYPPSLEVAALRGACGDHHDVSRRMLDWVNSVSPQAVISAHMHAGTDACKACHCANPPDAAPQNPDQHMASCTRVQH